MNQSCLFLIEFYTQCEQNPTSRCIVRQWVQLFRKFSSAFIVFTIFILVMFLLAPVGTYLVFDSIEPVIPVYLPGIDHSSVRGYLISMVYNVVGITATAIGFVGSDLTVFVLLLHLCPMAQVFVAHLKALERRLEDFDVDVDRESRRYLYNIVRMHRSMFNYIDMLTMLRGWFFIEIGLDGLGMCIVLFTMRMLTWPPLYLAFAYCMAKAFISCFIGTIVQIYVRLLL